MLATNAFGSMICLLATACLSLHQLSGSDRVIRSYPTAITTGVEKRSNSTEPHMCTRLNVHATASTPWPCAAPAALNATLSETPLYTWPYKLSGTACATGACVLLSECAAQEPLTRVVKAYRATPRAEQLQSSAMAGSATTGCTRQGARQRHNRLRAAGRQTAPQLAAQDEALVKGRQSTAVGFRNSQLRLPRPPVQPLSASHELPLSWRHMRAGPAARSGSGAAPHALHAVFASAACALCSVACAVCQHSRQNPGVAL
eukprot:50638-Chlamydomonas_euryale.AAC.2